MPRYNVSIEFDLETQIEPEGVRLYEPDNVTEYEDSSYFQSAPVEVYGGAVAFTVEAENETTAEAQAVAVVYDGMEVEDDNALTWQAVNVRVEVEKVEIPMDLVRATSLVQVYLSEMEGMDDDLKEAFGFLLDLVVSQEQRIEELARTNRILQGDIDRLRNGPDGSEAVAV